MDTMWVGHKTAYFVPGVVMLAPLISPIRFYDICIIFKIKKNYHHFSFKVWVSAPQLTNYKATFSNQKEKLTFLLRCLKVLFSEDTKKPCLQERKKKEKQNKTKFLSLD